VKIILFYFSL